MTDYYKLAIDTASSIINRCVSIGKNGFRSNLLNVYVLPNCTDLTYYTIDNKYITQLAFEMGIDHSWTHSKGDFSGVIYSSNESSVNSVIYVPNKKFEIHVDNVLYTDCIEELIFQFSTSLNSNFGEYVNFWKGLQSLNLDFPVVFNEICKDRLEHIKLILEK